MTIEVLSDTDAARAAKDAELGNNGRQEAPSREHLRDLAERARREARGGTFAGSDSKPASREPPPAPREPVDTIELEMPDGRVVLFGPPSNVSLTIQLLNYYGDRETITADEMVTGTLMCIREIDGRPCPPITDKIARDRLGNELGDDAISILIAARRQYWPPLRLAELPVLKKNLRVV